MSGGHFDHIQYRLPEVIDSINEEIRNNNAEERPQDFFKPNAFKEETINEFRKGIEFLKIAQIYAHRIDWLISGDDSEESFHERLSEDLLKMQEENK